MARPHHDGTKTLKEITVLCAERVSQMTNAQDDIEAVTQLLEEKERDLELAARIGQTLLSKNKDLSGRVEALEEQLSLAADKVSQLRHELSKKDELLKQYSEEFEHDSGEETTSKSGLDVASLDFLEKKVKSLEDENFHLRVESAQLKAETDNYEEKEKKLVEDCIQQLAEVNLQVESLAEELHQKAEESMHHKEETAKFLAQVNEMQKKIRKLTIDNMDLHDKLTASTESQRKLTQELSVMQDKYDELLEMLEHAQDELQLMKSRDNAHSRRQHSYSGYAESTDSLASELEASLQQEMLQSNRRVDNWKVFETARAAKQAAAKAARRESSSGTRMSLGSSFQQQSGSKGPSSYISDVESNSSIDVDVYESSSELGRPGIPGSNDLESALKRLALRRANEQNEKDFLEEEMERSHKKTDLDMHDGASPFNQNSTVPPKFYSPADSVSSRWSSALTNQHYKFPEKLQIVKPLEGSMTLRHWQNLATPHMGGIFEERRGVQMKVGKALDLTENSQNDIEEDDHPQDVYTRKEQDLGLIYTFTDSTVRNLGSYGMQSNLFDTSTPNPSDSSKTDSEVLHVSNIALESHHQVQSVHRKTADTQSTYSMSLGLASLLQGSEDTAHALMRASAVKAVTTTANLTAAATSELPSATNGKLAVSSTVVSSSDFNRAFFASRSFDSQPLTSTPKLTLGSRSFDYALTKKEDKLSPVVASAPPKNQETEQGFLQQLKSKGYSLYSMWGGGGKSTESNTNKGSVADGGQTPTAEPTVQSLATGAGILGAITDLRRSGML